MALPRFLDPENPLEKKIEERVCRYARERYGIESRKYSTPARRNAPDRIFFIRGGVHRGRMFMVEFKSRGKLPSKGQAEEIRFYRSLGFPVFVVDNVECGRLIVDIMA